MDRKFVFVNIRNQVTRALSQEEAQKRMDLYPRTACTLYELTPASLVEVPFATTKKVIV